MSSDDGNLQPDNGSREDNPLPDNNASMSLNSAEDSQGKSKLPCRRRSGCCKSIRKCCNAMGKMIKKLVVCGCGGSASTQGPEGVRREGLHNAITEELGVELRRLQPMVHNSHDTALLQRGSDSHPTVEHNNNSYDAVSGDTQGNGGTVVQSSPNYGVGGNHNGSGTQTVGPNIINIFNVILPVCNPSALCTCLALAFNVTGRIALVSLVLIMLVKIYMLELFASMIGLLILG